MTAPATKLNEPSILLASSNCRRMLRNISYVLDQSAIRQLEAEIERNVADLFGLGSSHFDFARTIPTRHWRQRVSRFYYAALNFRRAITLHCSGDFSTDVSDHKNIGNLPPGFPNANTYSTRLANLRDDRNIADYSHSASQDDLIVPSREVEELVTGFRDDSEKYLVGRGVNL